MDWAQLISSVGFPIVCAGGLFFGLKYMFDKYTAMLTEQDKRYDELAVNMKELCVTQAQLSEAVNNNTQAILKLINQ